MIMKYVEKPHAIAPNSATYQRICMHRAIMKNPVIIMKSRLAGEGSHNW